MVYLVRKKELYSTFFIEILLLVCVVAWLLLDYYYSILYEIDY